MTMHAHGHTQDVQDGSPDRYDAPLAPAWDVGRPQRAVYELEVAGWIGREVLDVGCGSGEHALWLARRGHIVCGVDPSALAIGRAQRRARREGLTVAGAVAFVVGQVGAGAAEGGFGTRRSESESESELESALDVKLDVRLESKRNFDCALDAGSFHRVPAAERAAYAHALATVVKAGGHAFVLCFADREKGRGGPTRVTREELAATFASDEWTVEAVDESVVESRLFPGGAAGWLLRAERLR
jgi:SAM-dependent methyltransferase